MGASRPPGPLPEAELGVGTRQERSELFLSQIDRSAQIANLVHAEHTMPFTAAVEKRPSAFLTGDHDDFPV